ncbi:MAG: hypothetical protein ABJC13_08150 [Acidobacteriota bacterium]
MSGGSALTRIQVDPTSTKRSRDLWASLLIGLCCLLVYNANGRAISAGDTYPARYLPFSIWRNHSVLLDPIVRLTAQGRGDAPFWMVPLPGGPTISLYPVVLPVLLAPLYLPAVGYLNLKGWTDARLDHVARVMEKLCASFVAALSASLLYLLLRRRASVSIAVLLTLAYAFGTTTWMIGSQALWQHGMAELLVVGALLLLTGPATWPRVLAVGLLCGLLAGNRPPDALLAAALGAYGLFWAGRKAVLLVAAAALPMGLVLLYNLGVAHNFAGAYGRMGRAAFFRHDLGSGLGGLLFSPTRGLFIFSPFLLFLVLAWRLPPEDRGLALALRIAVVLQILLYAKTDWRTGIYWGSRYLTDFLPMLFWMLVPVVTSLRVLGRILFGVAVGLAVAIEIIGAFWYISATDGLIASAWDWRNAPFVAALRHGPAPAELWIEMGGDLEAIETGGRATAAITAGQEIVAVGWALAGSATPKQVAVSFDGQPLVASRAFFDRPDLRAAQRASSPAGWRIPLDTSGLSSGEHHLTAFAWASGSGEGYYLGERKLTVQAAAAPGGKNPPGRIGQLSGQPSGQREGGKATPLEGGDLADLAKTAAARVREHQQEPGYWLTSYTKAARFEDPHPEMNTFLTSLLVELLDPLATSGGLGESLERARRHLTRQIEAGGLVRYHGLPDAPGIGTLGCPITPDSDDTALVWRLAPDSDRRRLSAALATLAQYRTPEGLYRTWLAPREAYQCLDPGKDPNPADIAIQMHLLLLLSKAQPPAGRALCKALRTVIDQDRIWVYYSKAPLIPILRLTDLERAGCKIELPESRMRTSVPDQEIWVSTVRSLGRGGRTGGPSAEAARIESILRQVSKDDFALLRKAPPLLYHNDLTATVSRYYWSEDVGYALWLRLYDQYSHSSRP